MKLHILQISAYLVIIAAGMKAAAPIMNIILVSLLFAISVMPIVIWLMKKGIPKSLALLIVIFAIIIITLLTGSILSVAIVQIAEKVPHYEEQITVLKTNTLQILSGLGLDMKETFSLQGFEAKQIFQVASTFIGGIISTFSDFTIVFLLIVFLLIDLTSLHYRVHSGDKKLSKAMGKSIELADEIRKYISISAFTGFLTAIGNLILLLILGVDFAFLWAFLSFLFSFIPNIGFLLSILPPAFLALIEFGTTEAIIVIIGFVIINAIVENVIKPRYMGEELNLSFFVIFISLIVWTWILGGMGAILAIPLTISAMKAREIAFPEHSVLK
jgi:predicted PurR-regulated permease PerM